MAVKKTPVYLLTGFLGAGKTTLLQTLLRQVQADGHRAAVLMNEFGKVSVDTLLLEQAAVPVVDLIEGCVCCTVRGSLTAAMEQLLTTYTPDVVFLEATGVAIPLEILDALLDEPLQSRVQIAGVLTLVDATQFPVHLPPAYEQTAMQQTIVEQVRHADVLLLSKTDLARPDRRFALESFLRGINRTAPLFLVVKGKIEAEKVLNIRAQARQKYERSWKRKPVQMQQRKGSRGVSFLRPVERKTSFGNLQTLHYEFTRPVDADRFYAFLHGLPETILRAKGFYREAENDRVYSFHYVPHRPMTDPVQGSTPQQMFAILIGEQLQEVELRKKLRACEVEKQA